MSNDKISTTQAGGGIGFCGLLAVLFIALKLLKVIDWSWWWVLAPLWMPVAFVLAVILIVIAVVLVIAMFKKGDL